MPAPLLLPNHSTVLPDFKNPTATANESHGFPGRFFNLCRHTVRFRAIVSLLAVFDLDGHGLKLGTFASASIFEIQNSRAEAPDQSLGSQGSINHPFRTETIEHPTFFGL